MMTPKSRLPSPAGNRKIFKRISDQQRMETGEDT
jgi:hypothetical protein